MQTTAIPAVQTRYNQYHFRSRAEARWCVLFDVLGVQYEYEPEKFDVGSVRYIPDFWLPKTGHDDRSTLTPEGCFFEVKGADPTAEEMEKAIGLAARGSRDVIIAAGRSFTDVTIITPYVAAFKTLCRPAVGRIEQCPFCGSVGFGYTYDEDPSCAHQHFCFERQEMAERYGVMNHFSDSLADPKSSPLLDLAREAAKSARFEDDKWCAELTGIVLAGRRLREQKVYCYPEFRELLVAKALEWKSDGGTDSHERKPWWVQHRADMRAGVSPCTCYSCAYDRKRSAA